MHGVDLRMCSVWTEPNTKEEHGDRKAVVGECCAVAAKSSDPKGRSALSKNAKVTSQCAKESLILNA